MHGENNAGCAIELGEYFSDRYFTMARVGVEYSIRADCFIVTRHQQYILKWKLTRDYTTILGILALENGNY